MVFSLNHLRVAFLSTLAVIFLSTLSYAQNEAGSGDRGRSSAEGTERDASERGRGGRRPRGGEGRGATNRGPRTEASEAGKPQVVQTKTPAKEQPKPAPEAKKKLPPTLAQNVADQFSWRSIGPANMGGRITAIAVSEHDHSTWWAATASGGLLKTTNDGNTFEHQFDSEATVSIGDVQVSASNPDIVWVGTGESNPRNSVSWGDGVYKSVDGGKTWKNMGLKDTFQTGALAIHPENPDVVWVGSLGRLWGPNPERGLFKTSDGGKTWKKVLFVNDTTGVIDVQLNPKNPDHLLVATYERKRDGFDGNDPEQRFGAGAGIYKSTDGGESFERVTKGLPSCKMGRIGLDFYEKDPKYVVAIVESEKIAKEPENYSFAGLRGEDAELGAKIVSVTKDGPSDKAGLKAGDIVASIDGRVVPSYSEMLKEIHKRPAGKTVKLVVSRERKLVDINLELGKKPESKSTSSSRNRRNDFTGTLGGQAANLQDTQGPDGYEYGGIYLSKDGGTSWSRINSLNPRPMYYSNIQVDPLDRNNIYVCGTSLYRSSDGGETFTGDGGSDGIHVDHHALWIDNKDPRHMILGNDGGVHVTRDRMEHWDHYNHVAIGQFYHASVDSNLDFNVYGGLQDNGSWGGPSRGKNGSGPINSDWISVGGGDGFVTLSDPNDPSQIYYESQNGGMG
ncbi:PDZ domain-containing protein, partial [Mariniblastus sp.]|nr:PDZ domain-containing protein [Mariniblastus sp.]